ncbi:fructosamine kinase family protein [Stieleria varia]|uniref:fructosamine kinase family protein n=1 Tax=Stieleria varia TaxID=2528005 RepID=UPI0011B477FE|nr:fructosamine kinase family protein [Stieleria varia]
MLDESFAGQLDPPRRVVESQTVGGGCISPAWQVLVERSDNGERERLFVKRNSMAMAENFRCEASGLTALAQTGTIRVPSPLATLVHGSHAYLVLPWIETSKRRNGFFEEFGRRLAQLHRATSGDQIGWHEDNFLGSAPQKNAAMQNWPHFVAEQRIGFQVRWAVDQGLADRRLQADCERIMSAMPEILDGRQQGTSLLHGDLWSGNYLCDDSGQPVLIDPAVSRGCREAEWGMIRLFGACPVEFEQAYQETWPMNDGWQRRSSVYVLYHLLNHLNLFGSGYLGQCRSLAAEIVSQ